jgi:transaldolase
MKFFVDTADVTEIRELADSGLLDGVTTNPSLIMKSGRNFLEVIKEICALVPGPVSAEVAATDFDTMMKEGQKIAGLAKNIAVKVPLTPAGLKVCKALSSKGTMVNVTLCFSANQALLAAKAGATFISPFIGRLDDVSEDGMQLIRDIVAIYRNYPHFKTEVLAASIRHPQHVREAALAGAHVATLPPATLKQLFSHPLTDKGLAQFTADWQKTGQSIL